MEIQDAEILAEEINGKNASWLISSLTVYRQITCDPVFRLFIDLLNETGKDPVSDTQILHTYHAFCAAAMEHDWPNYLIDLLLMSDNLFTRQYVHPISDELNDKIKYAVARDLAIIQALRSLTSKRLKSWLAAQTNLKNEIPQAENRFFFIEEWPEWPDLGGTQETTTDKNWLKKQRYELIQEFVQSKDWPALLPKLMKFHEKVGTGVFAKYLAFRYEHAPNGYSLQGIDQPDPVRLESLIGLEKEHQIILENTEHFLNGYPAQNILLYGNRGTGKSSTVKALLHLYADRKLRLIELPKTQLSALPELIKQLSNLSQKFLIFIDDLSFNGVEQDYKVLKTALEGGIAAQPRNVLIYATSNRRHLIKETFLDRQGDEVFQRDSMDEKLSLGDRFGITVTFAAPDQEIYLRIVTELAKQKGIRLPENELRQQALRWELWHNGRSGRSAKQFIDYLAAKHEIR